MKADDAHDLGLVALGRADQGRLERDVGRPLAIDAEREVQHA